MPARNSKGRFVKASRARKASTAIVVVPRSSPARKRSHRKHHKAHRRHRRHGAGMKPLHLALAAAGVAYLTSANGPQQVKDVVAKIPGNKTFGAAATLGITCLAIDKFVKHNKWLKLAGYAGIVAAAMKVGEQGQGFKWVGDDGYDIGDDGDIGDDDMADMGDIGDDE